MLKVNKEKLLNTRLGNGNIPVIGNEEGSMPCAKCALLSASNLCEDSSEDALDYLYWTTFGYFDSRSGDHPDAVKFRNDNPELTKIMDEFEQKLIKVTPEDNWEYGEPTTSFVDEEDSQRLIKELVETLEKSNLVEFV